MKPHYDVVIIGSGPAGFSCAIQSAKLDKSVLIIEKEANLGGTWINSGTVPSKALRETALNIYKFTSQFGDTEGLKPYQRFKMRDVLKYKDKVIHNENNEFRESIARNGVDTKQGAARIKDAKTVEITDSNGNVESVSTDYILIATGRHPVPPKNFEIDHVKVLDINSLMDLHHIPRRLVVVGANVHAMEYATIFRALGTKVTILNDKHDYLNFLDQEIKEEFNSILKSYRVAIHHDVNIQVVQYNPLRNRTEVKFTIADSPEPRVIETEQVLYFGSFNPNIKNLGLKDLGVKINNAGFIDVNDKFQTSIESIYAAGDVTGPPALASLAFSDGMLASSNMFGSKTTDIHDIAPVSIYSIPEVAAYGLTEKEAVKKGLNITVGRAQYENLTKADISKHRVGMLKLIFETETFRLLGVHIVGDGACEIIHTGQAVISMKGDVRYFIRNVMNYPSFVEAYRVAAFDGVNSVLEGGEKYKKILETTSE
ncbi:MAG: Si-specific NAD(P)(+) transhydrogenase [Balneolales bacterium]